MFEHKDNIYTNHRRENNIYTNQSADVFHSVTSCYGQAFIRIILLFHLSVFSEAVTLVRLVKAEIVSPYSEILINTGMGNPTAPLTAAHGR